MNQRNTPAEAWGQAIGFWCRIWQTQIDQSLQMWCFWARALPRPSAAELAAEADAMRQISVPGAITAGAKSGAGRSTTPKRPARPAKSATKPGTTAPVH